MSTLLDDVLQEMRLVEQPIEAQTEWLNQCHFGDVRDVLDYPWDLMIAHPPCTHLSVSGARHFAEKRMDGRQQSAVSFFMALARAPIPKIAIENPVCIMSRIGRAILFAWWGICSKVPINP